MHFVYDFDATLFKTASLWEAWKKVLLDFGAKEDEINEAGEELFGIGFSLEKHGESLGLEGKDFKKAIASFQKMTRDEGPTLVFEDVISFFEDNSEHRHSILTFGDHDYQHSKILACEIMEYLEDVRIAGPDQRKVEHLREMIETGSDQIVFIDDNPNELLSAHDAGLPITLIRMMRDGEKHAEEEHEFDEDKWMCVASLEEVKEKI